MEINNTSIHENISKLVSDEFIPPEFNLTLKTAIVSIVSIVIIFGTIVGNTFVITAFLMEPKIRHSFNYFILNLALSDILCAMFGMTFYSLHIILGYWPLGTFMCGVWIFIDNLLAIVTVFSIVAISLDRFWSVTWPNHYKTTNTTRKAVIVIAVIWLFCLTLWIPPFVINRLSSDYIPYQCFWEASKNKPFAVIVAVMCHYLPCVAVVACYMKILYVIQNRSKVSSIIQYINVVPGPNDTDAKNNNFNHSMKQKQNVDDATNNEKYSKNIKALFHDNAVPGPSQTNSNHSMKQKQNVDDATNNEEDSKNIKALFHDNAVPGPSQTNSNHSMKQKQNVDDATNKETDSNNIKALFHDNAVPGPSQTTSNYSMKQKQNVDDAAHKEKDSKMVKTLLNDNTTIEIHRCNRVRQNQTQSVKRERRMVVALGYIVGSFLICWFPSYIVFDIFVKDPEILPNEVIIFIYWVTYLNSLLNPIIYAYTSKQFRTVFRKICRCHVRCFY